MAKTLTNELAKRIGRDKKETESMLHALNQALRQHCGDLDVVAIPSFGNFIAIKHEEKEVVDRSTGHRLLLPPEVELTFKPAAKLRRLVSGNNEKVAER